MQIQTPLAAVNPQEDNFKFSGGSLAGSESGHERSSPGVWEILERNVRMGEN